MTPRKVKKRKHPHRPHPHRPLAGAKPADKTLADKLDDFMPRVLSWTEAERAKMQYFGKTDVEFTDSDEDFGRFLNYNEWIINDFRLIDGSRILDRFAQVRSPALTDEERRILREWQRNRYVRLFEIQQVMPGIGVTVKDLLSGEIMDVEDRSLTVTARRWMLLLARPYQAHDRVTFTGGPLALSPQELEQATASLHSAWAAFHAARSEATYEDFYREKSRDLELLMIRIGRAAAEPPQVLTNEGHPVVHATARFSIQDPVALSDALIEAEEFEQSGPGDKETGIVPLRWLDRGRSHVPKATPLPARGIVIQTHVMAGGLDNPDMRVLALGELTLDFHERRLELSCFSRERLAAGIALLKEVCGRSIRKIGADRVEPFVPSPDATARPPSVEPRPEFPREQILGLRRHLSQAWLDQPIPALDGLTPRQAVQSERGRGQLRNLLKFMEYMDDNRDRAADAVTLDVALLRRELGMQED